MWREEREERGEKGGYDDAVVPQIHHVAAARTLPPAGTLPLSAAGTLPLLILLICMRTAWSAAERVCGCVSPLSPPLPPPSLPLLYVSLR